MADPEQINADQRAFWNGQGGRTWVARQEHTDITLAPVSEALLALAAARPGEQVLDVGWRHDRHRQGQGPVQLGRGLPRPGLGRGQL